MIPQQIVEEILQKADIVQVISHYINVIKKGNSYVAICPFHDDKNPSMMISQAKQIYKCFVCGSGGNVFSFVQKYEKISFLDAVKKVAELIHFTSPYLEKSERKIDSKTKEMIKCLEDAKDFYHYVLKTNAGKKGMEYLKQRQISEEMISYFQLGFSPDNGENTIKILRGKNHEVPTLDQVGILTHVGSSFSDRFQGRLIFPIYNGQGDVIGFSARRVVEDESSKYVNSPSTAVFNKSAVLYNYQNAQNEAKNAGYCYVVEGFMDVFALYRCNIKSCVALMGTAFTKEHAKLLKNLNVEIRLCLDGDAAGQHGMMNMCSLLDEEQISYRIVNYESEKRDPDEIYTQDGQETLVKRVQTLMSKIDFLMRYCSTDLDFTRAEGIRRFIETFGPHYSSLYNPLDKDILIRQLAEKTRISQSTIKNYLEQKYIDKKKDPSENTYFSQRINKKMDRKTRIQRYLIYYLLQDKNALDYIQKKQTATFIDDVYYSLYCYIEDMKSEMKEYNPDQLILCIQNHAVNGRVDQPAIDEITSIMMDKSMVQINGSDKELIDECCNDIKNILDSRDFNKKFEDTLGLDEATRARVLDERKKGVN